MLFSASMKLALVVRTDLSMKKGKIAAQCCHAAIACYRLAFKQSPRILTKWERAGEPKVVLKVSSEEELLALYSTARSRGLIAEIVRDAGHTQVEAGSMTVLGIGPGVPSVVDEVVGHLKLL